MEINKKSLQDAIKELIILFSYDGNVDLDLDEDELKELLLEACTDIVNTDVLTPETAYIIHKLGVIVPLSTLINLGVKNIEDYDFDLKNSSKIKTEIDTIEKNAYIPGKDFEEEKLIAIPKERLKKILKELKNSVGNTNSLTYNASHIIFDNDKIYTFDGLKAIIYPFKIGIRGSINFSDFVKIVNSFKTKSIIQIEDYGDSMKLSCDNTEFILNTNSSVAPLNFFLDDIKWEKLPEDFCKGIELCYDSIYDDENKGKYSCLYVRNSQMRAFNNVSGTIYNFANDFSIMNSFFIPKNSCKYCCNFKPIHFGFNETTFVFFKDENDVIFAVRTLDEKGIDISNFFKKIIKYELIKYDKEVFLDMLRKAKIVAEKDKNGISLIELQITPLKLICVSKSGKGIFNSEMKIDYTGKSIYVKAMPDTLINIVKLSDEIIIRNDMIAYVDNTICKFANIIIN